MLVTGCYAQLEKEKIEKLAGNLVVIPQDNKPQLHKIAKEIMKGGFSYYPDTSISDKFSYMPENYIFHSRAFVKIQDGCDYMCTYCRVPLARGKSVSMDYKKAVDTIKNLETKGYNEAVLTGVNIASYRYGNADFNRLLADMLESTEKIRIRISSMEPEKANGGFLDIIKSDRICSHFHLPVQSGSDRILRLMKRRYNRNRILHDVERIRSVKDNVFLSADIIAGFPGENDEDFEQTSDLIKQCSFASMHIFRFSRRPGTEAYNMTPPVPERTVKERAKRLAEMEKLFFSNYIKNCSDNAEAVLEEKVSEVHGIRYKKNMNIWSGLTENYLKIKIINVPAEFKAGGLVRCRLLKKNSISGRETGIFAEYTG